jgi:hypothetical protein
VLTAQERWPEAEDAARAMIALSFEAAQAHFDLWQALEAQGKWRELEAAAGAFLAARPEHADARARLTRAQRAQRRLSGRRQED